MKIILMDGQEIQKTSVASLLQGGFFNGCRSMTTMRAQDAQVIDLDRHLDRLIEHSQRLSMTNGPSTELLRFEIDAALTMLATPAMSRIRVVLFSTSVESIHRIIEVESISDDEKNVIYSRQSGGVRLLSHTDRFWPHGSHIKTGLLGEKHVVVQRAKANGYDDVLWINGDGEVAEATWSNIFLIGRTGDLVEIATPPVTSGILLGIVRRRISELLNASQIPVTERVITIDEIPRFDEAFVTSSINGLVPVEQIDKHRFTTVRPNAVFNHINRLYAAWLLHTYSCDSN
jgi:branched-subunit amino acid aminotransferase/4-amino-4-deoxychorismate lyase